MRKFGITLAIIVVLIVVALLVAPHFLDVNKYHDRVQAELQQRLGRQVTLGQMQLSLLPLRFRVQNAAIGEDPRFQTGKPFAQAEVLSVSAKLWPLLHGDVEIDSVTLEKPKIELVRNAQGLWNFSSLGQSQTAPALHPPAKTTETPATPTPQQQPAPGSEQRAFTLADLKITDGQIALTDLQKHQSRAVYDDIDLELQDFAPNQAFTITASAHLPGKGTQTFSLDGTAGPLDQNNSLNTPFDGKLKLEQVSLSSLQKFLNTEFLANSEAVISGETTVKNKGGQLASDGSLKLDDARIHGVNIGYPIVADYSFSDDLNQDVLKIDKASLKLGPTPFSLTGEVNTRPTPALIDLHATTQKASIRELARLAAAFGVAFNANTDIAGVLTADIRAQGSSKQPQLNGNFEARDLSITGKELAQPVTVNALKLALTPTAIHSDPFSATTGGTHVDVQFDLNQYASESPQINATVKMAGAQLAEALAIANAYGVSATEGMSGTGLVSLDVHAAGPLKNMNALTFSGNGKLSNATLKMPSLTKPLGVTNADIAFSQNAASLNNLQASLGETHATGTLTLKNFAAPVLAFKLNADKMDLVEWQNMFANGAPAKQARFELVPTAYAAPAQSNIIEVMSGGGPISVGTLTYNQIQMTNVQSTVTLDHGVIRFAPLTAQVFNGQESGSIVIDTHPTPSTVTIATKLDKVDANKLLSSVSSVKEALYGLLAANANGTFSTGASSDQIARSLNGNVALDLKNGKLLNVNLMQQLATISQFVAGPQANGQNFTNLAALSGHFDIRNGLAQTNDLKAIIDGGTLAGTGGINLADQTVNMHVMAVLTKAMSDAVGGTKVGGFMNTALANNNGELVIPVIVTGNLQHPTFAPDLQKIAEMKLQNLLPTSGNPGQLTSGILGAILNKGGNNQGNQGGVGGIIGAITGQKNQQQTTPPPNPSGNQTNQQNPPQNQTNQQQQQNPLGDILNQVINKKKQQPQPTTTTPPPQNQTTPPPQNNPPKEYNDTNSPPQ